MKSLSRDAIQRMVGGEIGSAGSGGGEGTSLAGYASQAWVEQNYISKEFFSTLFTIHSTTSGTNVEPNATDNISSIEAKFGLWSEKYISALGQNSSGGGGGASTLAGLLDVELSSPSNGQALVYNATAQKWENQTIGGGGGGGTLTSIGLVMPTGFTVSPATLTADGSFTVGYATGYALPTTTKQSNWDKVAGATWWGQSLGNGTISGSLTGVGSITMSGSITMAGGITMSGSIAMSQGQNISFGGNSVLDYDGTQTSLNYGYRSSKEARVYGLSVGFYVDTTLVVQVVSGGLQIGDALLAWDSANNAIKVSKADGTAANLYTLGGISALGMSAGGGGNVTNLTVEDHLYLGDTDNYIFRYSSGSTTQLRIKGSSTVAINGNCTVSANGNTLTVPQVTIGTSSNGVLNILYNGTTYHLNIATAIQAGILTT